MSDNTLNIPSAVTDEIGVVSITDNSLPMTNLASVPLAKINNLMDIVESTVVSKLNIEKYLSFIDNPDVKQVVMMLTNDSSAVQDVINMIDLILADGKIDISDAPLLMGLIKKIISFRTKDLKLNENLTLTHYLDIIKLVLTILAKEGVLKIANTDEFIADIAKIINLLKSGEQIAESMSCFPMCMTWIAKKK
jgi:hypothetical protein